MEAGLIGLIIMIGILGLWIIDIQETVNRIEKKLNEENK